MSAMKRLFVTATILVLLCAIRLSAATAIPFEGGWEGEAETDRWPIFLTVRLARTGDTLSGKVIVLGQTSDLAVVKVSGDDFTFATSTDNDALKLEGKRVNDTLVGHLRQSGADLPFTFRRIPEYPKPANRVEAWAQDLDALEHRYLAVDRSFSPAERLAFIEALASIREELPRLDDAHITMRMASAIALAHNAHSRLYLLRNRTELRRLPVRVWWFSDGVRIIRATHEYERLLGCRVDRIAGIDVRHARDLVAPAFAGNPSWRDYMSAYSFTSPEALYGLGVTPTLDSVPMTVSGCAGASLSVDIAPLPLVKSTAPVESWWDLSPDYPQPEPWLHAKSGMAEYLRNPRQYYWFDFLPDLGIFYFHYNRAADMPEESVKVFAARLLAAFDKAKPKAFVLDLRFNTGGNGELVRALMTELMERTKGMPRFVIVGRATFSAGIAAAAPWRGVPDVTFVGEPIGDEMDFWSEGGNIILPNSGLAAHFANGAHSYSAAPCPTGVKCLDMNVPSMRPDVPALLSWDDYKAGRDPAMDAIVKIVGRAR
jgi:hypothetical protein